MRLSTPLFGLTAWAILSVSGVAEEAISGQGQELMGCPSEPSEELLAIADLLRQEEIENAFGKSEQRDVVVDTYIHIVAATEEEVKHITSQTLQEQIDILNKSYNRFGFGFRIRGVTRDISLLYSSTISYPADIVTRARHQGGYSALNVYLMTSLGGFGAYTTLGYGQFPKEVSPDTPDYFRDGVAILSSTIPGGSFNRYNSGKNLVHEAGHWLGLFHTFQGGCEGGDQVDDTPAQARSSEGSCEPNRDTCPQKPGNDPVHNFMDYSAESCKNEFTPGQKVRMHGMWNKFRAGKQAAAKSPEELPSLEDLEE